MKGSFKVKKTHNKKAFKIKIPKKDSGEPRRVKFFVRFKDPPTPTPDPCLADDFITKYVLLHWERVNGIFNYSSTAVGRLEPASGSNGVEFYQDLEREFHQLDTGVNHSLMMEGSGLVTFSGSGVVTWDGGIESPSGYMSGERKNVEFSGSPPSGLFISLESGNPGVTEISLKETYVSNGFPVTGNEIIDDATFTYPSEEFMYLEEFPGTVESQNIGWGQGYNEYILYPIRT